MAETQVPDEPGFVPDGTRGSFKLADAQTQNAARLAFMLDQLAARPAVRTLKSWALEGLAPAAGETAVDVGSGTGEDVVDFAGLVGGGRAVGVEPSAGLRAEAVRRAAGARVEFVDGHAGAFAVRGRVGRRTAV
jgi:ubiquinone/menaquinone biosynthesis C-methylase UbiE